MSQNRRIAFLILDFIFRPQKKVRKSNRADVHPLPYSVEIHRLNNEVAKKNLHF